MSRSAAEYGGAPKERRRRRAEKRLSKRVFLESPFLLCPLKVFKRTFQVLLRTNLKGAEKETDSPKTPFWTTVSPHDAFSAPLAHSESRIAEDRFGIALRIASYQCLMQPWNRRIGIARFWVARFSIQNRRFSATKGTVLHSSNSRESTQTCDS